MQDFAGKVAVVTGAASGIGLGLSRTFVRNGMSVAMVDLRGDKLREAMEEVRPLGQGRVVAIEADVAKHESVEGAAQTIEREFGNIHLVCNNAGVVLRGKRMEDIDDATWNWLLGVNLYGVIHGIQAFVPRIRKHGEGGHIVNTASMAGHTAFNGLAPYHATKHAVVALSEVAYHELATAGSPVGVSVLCPGFVNTRIAESDRNRPEQVAQPLISEDAAEADATRQMIRDFFAMQQPPEQVAELVRDAVVERRFYVFTDDVWTSAIAERHEDVVTARNPRPRGSMIEESMRG